MTDVRAPLASGPMQLTHGAIGNGRILALVAPDTSLDWLCLPRFDSASLFGRLLDEQRGGTWRIEAERHREARQTYQRNTNILVTRVTADDGVFDVYDFAPWVDKGYTMDAPVQLVRLLVPVEGNPRFRVTFEPAPDFARRRPRVRDADQGRRSARTRVRRHALLRYPDRLHPQREHGPPGQAAVHGPLHGRRRRLDRGCHPSARPDGVVVGELGEELLGSRLPSGRRRPLRALPEAAPVRADRVHHRPTDAFWETR
ncbi:MAG: trehalase-like domain-containing protein [Thermoanaerobaculia bacterium]